MAERNPEAVSRPKRHHLRILERRANFLVAKLAKGPYPGWDYDKAELAALRVALVELTEIVNRRGNESDSD